MADEEKKPGSLVVVGTGIKFLSHLSTEAKSTLQHADKLMYLVNDPLIKEWLSRQNQNAESLDPLYAKFENRNDNYKAITNYILASVKPGILVCVVFYGHPSVFCKPGLDAVKLAKKSGLKAGILPAISAEDCLFADLLIDPGSYGCQSYEATDLLLYQRQIDASAHLILWQIDANGAMGSTLKHANATGIKLLTTYLLQKYSPKHAAIIYEAAQYPGFEPRIIQTTISQLDRAQLSSLSSLYIPPALTKKADKQMLEKMKIKSQ